MDWPKRYAKALAAHGDTVSLSDEETGAILRLAREVAHRTERKNAPVAAYVAGRYVAERVRAGEDAAVAVRRAQEVAEGLLPPADPEPEPEPEP